MPEFSWPVRIYHEDVDLMGVVYYANYLKYYERARTEYLRKAGFEQNDLMRDQNVMFMVKNVKLDYLSPARYDDQLLVTAAVSSFKKASFQFDQKIYQGNEDGKLLNQATVSVVCVNAQKVRPCPIPEAILKILQTAS